jgi:hypothetical protein
MSTILGEMAEGSLLLEPSGKIVLANPAAHTFLGKDKLEGLSWKEIENAFEAKPAWLEVPSLGGACGMELVR